MKKSLYLTASLLLLTGCAHGEGEGKRMCPQVAMIRALSGIEANHVQAVMKKISGGCTYGKEGVEVVFDLDFAARTTTAKAPDKASFPFFVTVLTPNDTIMTKQEMSTSFTFAQGEGIATNQEPLKIKILTPEGDAKLEDYRVLVGFQLTKEQEAARQQTEK